MNNRVSINLKHFFDYYILTIAIAAALNPM